MAGASRSRSSAAGAPALFLDRDDTIVRDEGYMSRPEQIVLLPGAADALRRARAAGFRLYLVTNQSGIGRGYYTLADAEACNRRLEALLGLSFDGVCIAPERPDEPSRYRKPSPAYLLERIAADGLSLADTPDEDCRIRVIPGTGVHAGEIALKNTAGTLTYSGKYAQGFDIGGEAGSEWLYLATSKAEEVLTQAGFHMISDADVAKL